MSGQWEQYVEQAAEAMWESFRPGVWPRGDGVLEPIPAWADCAEAERESCRDEVRVALAVVGPLIAKDTRVRMVEAAAEIVKREALARVVVDGYSVYPTGYHATEIPSDKHSFVITIKDRGKGWAVCWMGDVLNREGEWEWEVQPSSRDDEFFHRCRFTEEEAKRRAVEAVDTLTINGRTFAEAVRWVRERS